MKSPNVSPVLVIIPTYKPDNRLNVLLQAIPTATPVVVSDDASPCTYDPLLRNASNLGCRVIRHSRNRGIARGLNDGLEVARGVGARWLLTLDQDSLPGSDYVDELLREAESRPVCVAAVGAEHIKDTSGLMTYPLTATPHGPTTQELIQTGTLWSVAALTSIGGFDESLGIDAVDAAASVRLREGNFTLAVAPGLAIDHALGSAHTISLLGRTIMVTGHSADRRTSMMRNRLRLFPAEFRQSPIHAIRTIRRVSLNQLLGLVTEPHRFASASATVRGLLPARSTSHK